MKNLDPSFIFDDSSFSRLAINNQKKYQNGDPFPHIVLDNFIDLDIARALSHEFPSPDNDVSWVDCDHENATKRYQNDETRLPKLIRKMLREFNSKQFILFVEALTGIDNLIPDPYFIGGGAHSSGEGNFLKVHADFNWHDKLHLNRRVNALFYLNEDWQDEWEGHLELWDKEMTKPVQRIAPILNRLCVFNVDQDANHGHPHPLCPPPGTRRKTLNLYYYTRVKDENAINDHISLYIKLNQNLR